MTRFGQTPNCTRSTLTGIASGPTPTATPAPASTATRPSPDGWTRGRCHPRPASGSRRSITRSRSRGTICPRSCSGPEWPDGPARASSATVRTGRVSLLPPRENWALLAAFGPDTANSEKSLAAITDSSVDYVRILYDQRQYPAGRYSVVDPAVLDGFDYVYAVTTVTQIERGPLVQRYESTLVASFDQAVRPRAAARDKGTGVWVVPNPFRARAAWDLPPVDG